MTDQVAPQFREVTVVAQTQDVRVRDGRGPVLRTKVRVLDDAVRPGPRGSRFHVVDVDTSTGQTQRPIAVDWEAHEERATDDTQLSSRAFRATNLFAVAANVLCVFEQILGRRMAWSFASPQLFLVPEAFEEDNAFYTPEQRGVLFGYVDQSRNRRRWTALSRDVISHEVTHAILDGLRPRWLEPASDDQPALHEALADIVALFSVMSSPEVVERVLIDRGISTNLRRIDESFLFDIAGAASSIRSSLHDIWKRRRQLDIEAFQLELDQTLEPHQRCEYVVAAACQAVVDIWKARCALLRSTDREGMSTRAIAEEGAKAAAHVLGMCIRALDYLPPVDVEFEDFIDAVLIADEDVTPNDDHNYRPAMRDAFAMFGIEARYRPSGRHVSALQRVSRTASYHNINQLSLVHDADEVYRFIWQNPWLLCAPQATEGDQERALTYHLDVERVRATIRTGPDGLVLSEVFADFTQTITTTAGDLRASGVLNQRDRPPKWLAELDDKIELRMRGGGVLVFGQFGHLRLVCHKRVDDWRRQRRLLGELVTRDIRGATLRFGFSSGGSSSAQFQRLHGDASKEVSW
jgi:hypothetical protein